MVNVFIVRIFWGQKFWDAMPGTKIPGKKYRDEYSGFGNASDKNSGDKLLDTNCAQDELL